MKFWIYLLLPLLVARAFSDIPPDQIEFFESKIRPVLAEHCYECHNSVNKSKAGLALDYRDALLAGSENGRIIEIGDPARSPLIWAIRHEEDLEMPSKAPKLADAVIRDFEEWVSMGAPDPRTKKPTQLDLDNAVSWETLLDKRRQWWSFQPLQKSKPPKITNSEWNPNPIDRYIFKAFDDQGLEPQDKASSHVLVRRAHLILTGLPPKADVVEEFVNDPSEQAYRVLIDSLLDSEAFGERWARHWMDWYRFAESHGSEGDPTLPYANAYRHYIIRALNNDVPYDQLLREHIAGDLLKKPRINEALGLNESAIGPAHLRMVPHGFGVTDAYAEQIATIDNQIDVMSKAMLGLTVSCARCHNHKFDPISQKDFYRLYGILASNRPGTRDVNTDEKQSLNRDALVKLKSRIRKPMADYWLENVDVAIEQLAAFPIFQTKQETERIAERKKAENKQKKNRSTDETERSSNMLKKEMDRTGIYHTFAPLYRWKDESATALAEKWNSQIRQYEKDLNETETAKKNATFYADLRDQKTLDSWYQNGNGLTRQVSPPGAYAIAGDGVNAITGIYPAGIYSHLISDKHTGTLASPNYVAAGDWSYMRAIGKEGAVRMSARNYPLSQGLHPYSHANSGSMQWLTFNKYKFWNGEQVHFQVTTMGDKPVGRREGRSWFGVTDLIGGNVKLKELGNPLYVVLKDEPTIQDRPSLINAYEQALRESIIAWKQSETSDAQAQYLGVFVRFNILPNRFDSLPDNIASLFSEYRKLENEIPEPTRAPGIFEGDIINQPLLVRGDPKNEADPVPRRFLEVFSNKPYSNQNSGRLELAEDIAGKNNPLKSRVLVNRLWCYVFGRGIVASTDNFGRLGKEPTHPKLLDYLALNFEKNDGSVKTALREMMLSRTFRSSSSATQAARERDPENTLLSFYTPRRLDAEAIMDSVNSMARTEFQRGVYAKTKRNQLNAFLTTFNLPIPTTTVSQRDRTNVPAQALSMMNGVFVQNAAKEWARKVRSKNIGGSVDDAIETLYMDAYARVPKMVEKDRLTRYYKSIENSETALERIAFALLNSKEFIYVY
ncbi:MAG: PSD1 and planctomycete cytochrome C domain-containing protein [Kiritimatiellae bacterium]|nr:PSD1 and planctomycete cytochrome C domain-containing protein [Kiritimatiellia bacterium]